MDNCSLQPKGSVFCYLHMDMLASCLEQYEKGGNRYFKTEENKKAILTSDLHIGSFRLKSNYAFLTIMFLHSTQHREEGLPLPLCNDKTSCDSDKLTNLSKVTGRTQLGHHSGPLAPLGTPRGQAHACSPHWSVPCP